MSSFKKAPLIEVIFELRWALDDVDAITKSQYLIGDLYSNFSKQYPFRENIVDPSFPLAMFPSQPTQRYRKSENGYPLIQVGPGIITLNSDGGTYVWEKFTVEAENLVEQFINLHPISHSKMVGPSIVFVDFFKFNFQEGDIYDFIDRFFNVDFRQNFLKTNGYPNGVNINFSYEIELGQVLVSFVRGKNISGDDGLILQTRINSSGVSPKKDSIMDWLSKSHRFCSDLFKELTKGSLLDSFQ